MTPRLPPPWLALAIILLVAADWANAEPLGRLFLTPERRATLEQQRQLNIQETQTLEGEVVSLNGIVTRSSGKHTVWVNQRPQNENSAGTGVTAAISPANPGRAVITAGRRITGSPEGRRIDQPGHAREGRQPRRRAGWRFPQTLSGRLKCVRVFANELRHGDSHSSGYWRC